MLNMYIKTFRYAVMCAHGGSTALCSQECESEELRLPGLHLRDKKLSDCK